MAANSKAMYRGVLTNSSATLYTVPSGTTSTVTNIVLVNTSASPVTATIALNGTTVVPTVTIAANGIFAFDLKQVLLANQLITGQASAGSAISAHISGVEVTP